MPYGRLFLTAKKTGGIETLPVILMPPAGLEPARISPLDFESSASANSATAASNNIIILQHYGFVKLKLSVYHKLCRFLGGVAYTVACIVGYGVGARYFGVHRIAHVKIYYVVCAVVGGNILP